MEDLLALVGRLQSACQVAAAREASIAGPGAAFELPALWGELPVIVVIGGQSSGKSSVLEAIVGRDFLPRGSGIVTRRPLLLKLVGTEGDAIAEFEHLPGKKFTDFAEVRKEIEADTIKLLGNNKTVSPKSIVLTIKARGVPNLTLVDMPGLTKVPVEGQSPSIVADIEKLARTYVTRPQTLILAVSPANADIATSDAIRLAKDVDPGFERTIGVLTKLDLMDQGTDAVDVLAGRTLPLKHGWVGVVLRSQKDIAEGRDASYAQEKEKAFFAAHKEYKAAKAGTASLVKVLSERLQHKIAQQIPAVKEFLAKHTAALEAEARELGYAPPTDRGGMQHEILELARDLERRFVARLEGGAGGGERVLAVLDSELRAAFKSLPLGDKTGDFFAPSAVRRVVEAADGYTPHLVAPEAGYRRLIKMALGTAKQPVAEAVEKVAATLSELVSTAAGELRPLSRYKMLRASLLEAAATTVSAKRTAARSMAMALVEMEADCPTAAFFRSRREVRDRRDAEADAAAAATAAAAAVRDGHPASASASSPAPTGGGSAWPLSGLRMPSFSSSTPPSGVVGNGPLGAAADAQHFKTIGDDVRAYVTGVYDELQARIPKAVLYCLVLQAKAELLMNFYAEVSRMPAESLKSLLAEDSAAGRRRAVVSERLSLLRKAQEEVAAAAP